MLFRPCWSEIQGTGGESEWTDSLGRIAIFWNASVQAAIQPPWFSSPFRVFLDGGKLTDGVIRLTLICQPFLNFAVQRNPPHVRSGYLLFRTW
ncbi:unnamed protein product [Periconia digitata]|uniref:Uncharacterized protein n=1 Tax=Periconia digitata TaxID=1303443 RepID=A0A9W4XHQ3_9PLEO|nr:unnamed protein product [Periconia digitata]